MLGNRQYKMLPENPILSNHPLPSLPVEHPSYELYEFTATALVLTL
jgi:hypothetical protein